MTALVSTYSVRGSHHGYTEAGVVGWILSCSRCLFCLFRLYNVASDSNSYQVKIQGSKGSPVVI